MSAESKPIYFTFATAGHVDHGKTSVLRALTGIDPDRLKEEKQRQMTTDIGFAHLDLPVQADGRQLVLGFIDVPGHGKFLKNMLAGVGGIAMALLVVAADEGPMPQTISHVKILSLLGVSKALVVLTKIDVADESRQNDVEKSVRDLLARYQIQCLSVARVSNSTKEGFDELRRQLVIASEKLEHPNSNGGAVLPIDRVFSKSGYGVVVTGTLVSGHLAVGASISIEPGGIKGRVRGLETFKRQLQEANAGQRLAVNIALKESAELVRGQVVADWNVPVVNTLIARIEQVGPANEWVKPAELENQPVRLYHGTAECFGHLRWCQQIEYADCLIVQIALQDPLVAEPGDRFVVRYGDEGITGGVVLTTSRPRWLTRSGLVTLVDALVRHDYNRAVDFYLEHMTHPASRESVLSSFVPLAQRAQALAEGLSKGSIIQNANYVISAKRALLIKEQVVKMLSRADATASGPPEYSIESVRAKVAGTMDRQMFQHFLRELADAGSITRDGDKIALKSDREATVSPAQTQMETSILNILAATLCIEIDEIAKQLKSDRKTVQASLQSLSKQNKAHVVDHEYASSAQSIQRGHEALATIYAAKKEISPSEFRESLGTSRKYAMALLAYFDNKLITRRVNNTRILIKVPS